MHNRKATENYIDMEEMMNTELIFKYLSALKENNDRDWYHQHKIEYKELPV